MLNHALLVTVAFLSLCSGSLFADDPEIKTFEQRSPTGVLQKRFQYYLKDGEKVKHGSSSIHYKNGQVLTSTTYQHGQRHGTMRSYYQWIDKLSFEGEYANDRSHGTTRYWSPTGELLFE